MAGMEGVGEDAMIQYPALLDGVDGAYGVVFPDIPGVGAMGYTVEDALRNAEYALQDYAIEMARDGEDLATPSPLHSVEIPAGNRLVTVALISDREPATVQD